jgi:hypothetical protein
MRTIFLIMALLVSLAQPVWAQDEMAAGRTAISAQTEAIGRDDATAAYSYAAPNIQAIFMQADVFMIMVHSNYAALYHPKRFEFGEAGIVNGKITQHVHIIDSDGVSWEAVYTLQQQSDGSMKISGCMLVKQDQAV